MDSIPSTNDGSRARQYKAAIREDGGQIYANGTPAQQRTTLQQEYSHANQMPVDSYQPSQGGGFGDQLSNLRHAFTWGWNR